jgi:mannose-1-phosphate guanylyltransferase / mannose-6-phosphate isomerase
VHENESIYIPIGAPASARKSRQDRPGAGRAQTGSYLGEDDIVRIEDDYRRS